MRGYEMYESPIEIIHGQIQMEFEDNILKAVQNVGINVNKDALISALMYDRHQYEKGYEDGKQSIIHCKDCKHWKESDGTYARGIHAESKCPMNRKEVYEGTGFCYMAEPKGE